MGINKDILEKIKSPAVTLLGIPFDDYSSHLKGTAEAPQKIREALFSDSSNTFAENGINIVAADKFYDAGDLNFEGGDEKYWQIDEAVTQLLNKNTRPLSLGGDHSVTYPILIALNEKYSDINILQFDAHPDLYDEFEGNRYSHACPFARIMENGLAGRLVQVGIRTANDHQRKQAKRFGAEVAGLHDEPGKVVSNLEGPVYISLDMDVLDPAFAPGISHPEPGGLSTRRVLDIIHAIDAEIIGADIVEYNPVRDVNGVTAMTAAKFVKEIAGKIIGDQ